MSGTNGGGGGFPPGSNNKTKPDIFVDQGGNSGANAGILTYAEEQSVRSLLAEVDLDRAYDDDFVDATRRRMWSYFRSAASSLTLLYRGVDQGQRQQQPPSDLSQGESLWVQFQTAAGNLTHLYRESMDNVLRGGGQLARRAGHQRARKELMAWARTRRRFIHRDELLAKISAMNYDDSIQQQQQQQQQRQGRRHHRLRSVAASRLAAAAANGNTVQIEEDDRSDESDDNNVDDDANDPAIEVRRRRFSQAQPLLGVEELLQAASVNEPQQQQVPTAPAAPAGGSEIGPLGISTATLPSSHPGGALRTGMKRGMPMQQQQQHLDVCQANNAHGSPGANGGRDLIRSGRVSTVAGSNPEADEADEAIATFDDLFLPLNKKPKRS